MSYYVFDCQNMLDALDYIRADNDQGEYYITDLPRVFSSRGLKVRAVPVLKPCEVLAVNYIQELAAVEAEIMKMSKG